MAQGIGTAWWRPAAPPAAQDRGSALAFAALVLFVVLLLLAPQAFIPGLGRVRVALLVGAAAVLAHCWTRFAAGRPLMRPSREMGLIAALLAWIIATLPLSRWPGVSAQILLGDYLKTLGVFWLLSAGITTIGHLRTMAWTLSLTALPMAATGVANFVSGNLQLGRVAGFEAPLTADPNALAMVLNLILPFTIALLTVSRRPLVRAILIALIVLDVSAVIVTFSRGGFLTLAVIVMLSLRALQRRGHRRWAVAALLLVVAATPVLPLGYLDRLGTIGNIEADETGSAQERWELQQHGLRYALSHPLPGAGLGMNVLADCARRGIASRDCARVCAGDPLPPCQAVHNLYLQLAMDLGWPGLGLFLLLLASAVRGAARVRDRSAGDPARRDLAVLADAIRIAIVAFAVAALFYPWAYLPYFYLAAGLAAAAGGICGADLRSAGGPAHLAPGAS